MTLENTSIKDKRKFQRIIHIDRDGGFKETKIPEFVVRSKKFDISIPELTKSDYFRALLFPDKWELFLFPVGLLIIKLAIQPFTQLPLYDPGMIVFWGIISFMLFTGRWAYWGPTHFAASVNKNYNAMVQGEKILIDFKIFGMIASFVIIGIGVLSSNL